jgi:hypothetical protein
VFAGLLCLIGNWCHLFLCVIPSFSILEAFPDLGWIEFDGPHPGSGGPHGREHKQSQVAHSSGSEAP